MWSRKQGILVFLRTALFFDFFRFLYPKKLIFCLLPMRNFTAEICDTAHQREGDTLQVKSILNFVFDVLQHFSALKMTPYFYQNCSRHSHFTIETGSKIHIVFLIIFWMFLSVSKIKKTLQLQSLPGCAVSHVLHLTDTGANVTVVANPQI